MSDKSFLLRTLDHHKLNAACLPIFETFGHRPYLVGSVHTRRDYRDVDVRLILPDGEFDSLFGGRPQLWSFLCVTIADSLAAQTGLPIDFQIQRMTEANARHPGMRSALGMPTAPYAGGGDATPST